MSTSIEMHNSNIDTYVDLFNKLKTTEKINLLKILSTSLKEEISKKDVDFLNTYGAWDNETFPFESAEDLRKNRHFIQKDLGI